MISERAYWLSWQPVTLGVLTLVSTFTIGQLVVDREHEQLQDRTSDEAKQIAGRLEKRIQERVEPLSQLGKWWLSQGRPFAREDWETDASLFLLGTPGLKRVTWLSANGLKAWSVRPGRSPETERLGQPAPGLQELSETARKLDATVFSKAWKRADGRIAVYACSPISNRSGRVVGFLIGLYDVQQLLHSVTGDQFDSTSTLELTVDGHKIGEPGSGHPAVLPGVSKEAMITLPNAAWVVRVNAPAADVAQVYRAILSLGITLAALLYICSAMWLIFRRRAMDLERANGALQSEMRMRERAEQTVAELNRDLQRRLSEFETLVDVIPVGIAVSQDPDCREIWINPALARIMGTARDANISKSGPDADKLRFRFLHDGEDVPVDELPMQRVARTGLEISGEELDIEREDGQIVRTLAYTSPLFDEDGRVRGVLNACVDITDRKRAEQERSELLERERMARLKAEAAFAALEASRASFQRLIESDVIGVIVADSRRVLDCNEYFLSLLGYTRAEATGVQIRWSDIIPPEYRAEYGRQMRQLAADGRFGVVEVELLRRDGGRVPVALGGARIDPEVDGRCVGFVLNLSKLRELERRVQRAEKFKSLALMAGGVAHDFNNLLTGILGNAALALDLLPSNSEARTFVGRSVAASNRAAELIAQLLAYTGRTFYSPVTVNLSGVVASMEAALREMAPTSIDLRFELAADLPPVHAGVSEVQRVVRNLVLNAVEAAQDDRIVIEVKTAVRDLSPDEISGLYPDQDLLAGTYVSLVVSDTGCGIREEDVSKVFDPFFTTKFVGRGLGLSTVYGIVRGHHGGIRIESSVESGTHIEVLLPSQATAPVNFMAAMGASTTIGVQGPESEQATDLALPQPG